MQDFEYFDYTGSSEVVDEITRKIYQNGYILWCYPDEYTALFEIARGYHNKPETEGYVIEFGTHRGASACMLAGAIKDSGTSFKPIFTMDIYPPNDLFHDQNYKEARESFVRADLLDFVCPMTCDGFLFRQFWNLPARMIFIDTSHTYENTKREIQESLPLIVDDGWLVLHDYGGEYGEGVVRALNEFLDNQTEYDLDFYLGPNRLACLHVKHRIPCF